MAVTANRLTSIRVRCDRAAPCAIRAWLASFDHLGWVIGDATLVASELVSNAVIQAGERAEWIEVTMSQRGERIVIAVSDPRSGPEARDLESNDGVGAGCWWKR